MSKKKKKRIVVRNTGDAKRTLYQNTTKHKELVTEASLQEAPGPLCKQCLPLGFIG